MPDEPPSAPPPSEPAPAPEAPPLPPVPDIVFTKDLQESGPDLDIRTEARDR